MAELAQPGPLTLTGRRHRFQASLWRRVLISLTNDNTRSTEPKTGKIDIPLRWSVLHAVQLTDAFVLLAKEQLPSAAQVTARAAIEASVRAAFLAVNYDLPRELIQDRIGERTRWGGLRLKAWAAGERADGPPKALVPEFQEALKQIERTHPRVGLSLRMAVEVFYYEASELVHGSPYGALRGLMFAADPNEEADALCLATMALTLAQEGLLLALAEQPHLVNNSYLKRRAAWAGSRIGQLTKQASDGESQ